MKVLLINGSPRENGNTARALMEVADTLAAEGVESEIFWIGKKPVRGCCACYQCVQKALGRCVFDGEGLAIITPPWMRHILSEKTLPRFVKYGVNVFGIDAALPPREIAEKAIQATHDFFASIGIPMTLRAVGIDESRIDEMARHVAETGGLENAWVPLTEADIAAIFRASL